MGTGLPFAGARTGDALDALASPGRADGARDPGRHRRRRDPVAPIARLRVYLFRDFVTVPEPARPASLLPDTYAALRAWPLDGVMWALRTCCRPVQQPSCCSPCRSCPVPVNAALLRPRAGRPSSPSVLAGGTLCRRNASCSASRPPCWRMPRRRGIVVVARSDRPMVRRLLVVVLVALPAALTPWGWAGRVGDGRAGDHRADRRGDRWPSPRRWGSGGACSGCSRRWPRPTPATRPLMAPARSPRATTPTGAAVVGAHRGGVWSETARPASRADALGSRLCGAAPWSPSRGRLPAGRRRWIGAGLLVGPAGRAPCPGPVDWLLGCRRVPGGPLLRTSTDPRPGRPRRPSWSRGVAGPAADDQGGVPWGHRGGAAVAAVAPHDVGGAGTSQAPGLLLPPGDLPDGLG